MCVYTHTHRYTHILPRYDSDSKCGSYSIPNLWDPKYLTSPSCHYCLTSPLLLQTHIPGTTFPPPQQKQLIRSNKKKVGMNLVQKWSHIYNRWELEHLILQNSLCLGGRMRKKQAYKKIRKHRKLLTAELKSYNFSILQHKNLIFFKAIFKNLQLQPMLHRKLTKLHTKEKKMWAIHLCGS